ncbi:MAG TPA: hypothetical protein VGM05_20615 [Planctomycetaceae bacterium]|jgi:hypothetical protein
MADRKKPGAAFWSTVVVAVVLVGYPLSFGPACWISSRMNSGAELVHFCYRPIVSGLSIKETRLSAAIQWYARWGASSGWRWAPDGIPLSDDRWVAVEWVWMRYP